MNIISVTLHNFMPFKGEQVVEFPDSESENIMVIHGNNMRGKTSFLNAIRWAFYGCAYGRHLREIPLHLLINSEAASNGDWFCEVQIKFKANGHDFQLRRSARKKRLVATPSKAEDFDMEVRLQKDSYFLPASQIDEEINNYIPEKVSRFFLFDGELLQEYESLLIEDDETGKKIKEAIEQVLGVPSLIKGREDLATLLKQAQRQNTKDIEQIKGQDGLAQKQERLQKEQEILENDCNTLKNQLLKIKTERMKLDDELEKLSSVSTSREKINNLNIKKREVNNRLHQLDEEKLMLLSEAWRDILSLRVEKKIQELSALRNRIMDEAGDKKVIESQLNILKNLIKNSTCPTCGQVISDDKQTEIMYRIPQLTSELAKFADQREKINSLSLTIGSLERLRVKGDFILRLKEIIATSNKLEIELTQIDNQVEQIQEEIKGYDTDDIARKKTHRDMLVRSEGKSDSEIQKSEADLKKKNEDLAILARQIASFPASRSIRSTRMVTLYTDLENIFRQSIDHLRNQLRKQVENYATQAFCAMTTQSAYKSLRINNNYGLTIYDEHNRPVTVRSAGAEQVVALSLIDGLGKAGRSAGPIVMDTPFGRLDARHRENILNYLPNSASQLVLLVHDGEIRREQDLQCINHRVGIEYQIIEITPRHSKLERL